MDIGIIGAGQIGGTLTRRLTDLGHNVFVANSRGPETLADLARETGATPVTPYEAARRGEIVIVTIPQKNIPKIDPGGIAIAAAVLNSPHKLVRFNRTKAWPSATTVIERYRQSRTVVGPGEVNVDGQIRKEGQRESREGNARAQARHVEKRPLGQEGDEQETGDRNRPFGSPRSRRQGASQEGFEEGIKERFEETIYQEAVVEEEIFKELTAPLAFRLPRSKV
jgi:hypothetical protein